MTIDSQHSATPVKPSRATPRAAYLHVPFCRHRCGYCNFTLVARRDDLVPAYLDALQRELSQLGQPRPVDTLFFGGGTPTHLSPDALEQLLTLAARWFPLAADGEFSVEANPLDLDPRRLELLARFGVNRLSLGVQSFADAKLQLLERDHRRAAIEEAVARARPYVRSLSLDLIFGVPGESLEAWQADVEAALALGPDHLSTYGLTIEKGTQFWNRAQRGELASLPDELERTMYEWTADRLTSAGWEHYEVSNFARPGFRCRHNETYWLGRPYFAAGPGAARFVEGRREVNHRSTSTYIRRLQAGLSPVAEWEELNAEDAARERLVFGLRRLEGVEARQFQLETGFSVDQLAARPLQKYVPLGLFQWDGVRLQLTRAGLLVSDSLWPAFLAGD